MPRGDHPRPDFRCRAVAVDLLAVFTVDESSIARIRSMWISVSFARWVADLDAFEPFLTIMLFSKFLRSSNIRSETHNVSSIFSD